MLRGRGRSHGHHGEILQGVFEKDGRLHRGLATMPCSLFSTYAEVELGPDDHELTVTPAWKTKAVAAVRKTVSALGLGSLGGRLRLDSDIRVGCGFGSSTSDVIASINAVLDAAGRALPGAEIAELAVGAEVASDPLMFDHALLFAHRRGRVIEDFAARLPRLAVLGCEVLDEPVDTLTFPPARYSVHEIESFRPLLGRLRRAIATGSVADIGRVATASARINQRFLPIPRFDDLLEVAHRSGAHGVQVAHSGSVAGLLFDPNDDDLAAKTAAATSGLLGLGVAETWSFVT